jgi:glycosyltransferase involved in cell wall biosynthesis
LTDHQIAFVVPTADRPEKLRAMLRSLEEGTVLPTLVVIVDAGENTVEDTVASHPNLNIKYLRSYPPDLCRQRNAGMAALDDDITLAGYLDDDIVLEPSAVEVMLDFWDKASQRVGGARFNVVNEPAPVPGRALRIFYRVFCMWTPTPGAVLPSGYPTPPGVVQSDQQVHWISGGCTLWRRDIVDRHWYDEWFQGVGYLEDLEYSFRVGREADLFVVANARVRHFPTGVGKGKHFRLGKWQVINRRHIVQKFPDELRLSSFYRAITGQFLYSLLIGILRRSPSDLVLAAGNLAGLFRVATRRHQTFGGTWK